MSEEKKYLRLNRDGLAAYFRQMDIDNDGRVEWSIDVLVDLMVHMEHQAYEAGKKAASLTEHRNILESLTVVADNFRAECVGNKDYNQGLIDGQQKLWAKLKTKLEVDIDGKRIEGK